MAAKYQIRTIVDQDIKKRIADLMEITGHSESKQTKMLLKSALDMNTQLTELKNLKK